MANPYRATVTIDGESVEAISASVAFNTLKDQAQMPVMGSLTTHIAVWIDLHDTTNIPYSKLNAYFELAKVVTNDKIKAIKIEFWQDDTHEDAVCVYNFNGWISTFETKNPLPETGAQTGGVSTSSLATVNNMLYMELTPAMNQAQFGEIAMAN